MQSLALLLLLGVVASTMFGFAPSVLAQETPDEEVVEETDETMDDGSMEDTMEDTMEEMPDETMEDTAEEEMTDDAMEDDSEMETEELASPLQQLKSGVDPHEIQCGDGLQLVFKASNFRPMCIKESSHSVLLQRGWVSDHDPSHEDLMGMLEGIPKDEVMEETMEETDETMEETDETMEETDGEVILEEEVEVEEDATSGNGTEPTPQSYTIELAESMEMGAN
jgi:hypothetical protein